MAHITASFVPIKSDTLLYTAIQKWPLFSLSAAREMSLHGSFCHSLSPALSQHLIPDDAHTEREGITHGYIRAYTYIAMYIRTHPLQKVAREIINDAAARAALSDGHPGLQA